MARHVARSIAVLVLIAACTPAAGWVGDGAHAVEGYWVLAESRCDQVHGTDCAIAVDAAMGDAGLGQTDVTAASTADWPRAYRDGHGGTILRTTGGLMTSSAVVLDLADGSRRLVNVFCGGPVTTDDGAVVQPRTCGSDGSLPDDRRVGREPWATPAP